MIRYEVENAGNYANIIQDSCTLYRSLAFLQVQGCQKLANNLLFLQHEIPEFSEIYFVTTTQIKRKERYEFRIKSKIEANNMDYQVAYNDEFAALYEQTLLELLKQFYKVEIIHN